MTDFTCRPRLKMATTLVALLNLGPVWAEGIDLNALEQELLEGPGLAQGLSTDAGTDDAGADRVAVRTTEGMTQDAPVIETEPSSIAAGDALPSDLLSLPRWALPRDRAELLLILRMAADERAVREIANAIETFRAETERGRP